MSVQRILKFENAFWNTIRQKSIHEASLLIENTSSDFAFQRFYGGLNSQSPLFLASITKLFTTACILILWEQGKISLHDKIFKFFRTDTLKGLHVYNNTDFSFGLTIANLLFQTSGLPDLYEEGKENLKNRMIKKDFTISFLESLAQTKNMKPHFLPSTKGKAHYADINFDILGHIIETVSGIPLGDAFKRYIFQPLELVHTYLPKSQDDSIPPIYYKEQCLFRPQFVKSSGASGGCVSTAEELMVFVKAFFTGKLFSTERFDSLNQTNKLQFSMGPIRYAGGYMQIPLKGWNTFFQAEGELLGHSGSTGSFAFYYPLKELFFVGNVNQMANASLPIRLCMQLAIAANR